MAEGEAQEGSIEAVEARQNSHEPVSTSSISESPPSGQPPSLETYQVHVKVRSLSIKVDPAALSPFSSLSALQAKLFNQSAKFPPKHILRDVSADLQGGSLTAIIGASGSGKTSLLNAISHRVKDKAFQKSGSIYYEPVEPSSNNQLSNSRTGTAYVMQQDVLLPSLTVRETLQFAADLRLSTTRSKSERRLMVEDVIQELGLSACAATRIGDDAHKGCSGGEKRRTSIGIQLLADQPVLILDEPTTGLDAASALQVVETLKGLAQKGKTVIMTIHQPRSEIWTLVDHLILLSRGEAVYSGSVAGCLPYFESLNYRMPAFHNPFDFVIDLAAVDLRSQDLEKTSLERVHRLQEAWRTAPSHALEQVSTDYTVSDVRKSTSSGNKLSGLWHETITHTRRTFIVTCRDRLGLLASMIESLSMGIMSGWIFYQLDTDLAGIRSRQGAMYSACALQGYLILLFETYRLTIDITTYDRERIEGVVKPISFIVSRRASRFILEDLPVPLFYSILFYFMAGFRSEASQFFTFFAIQLLLHLIAVNLATVCVALSRQFMVASLYANLSFTLQSTACGFFANTHSIAIWLRWIKWTAYTFYAFGALCTNEFYNRVYDCPSPDGLLDPVCKEYTGAYILASLNLPSNWLWRPIVVLFGFVIFFFVLSGVILHIQKTEVEMAKIHSSEAPESSEGVQLGRALGAEHGIRVSLEHFGLEVDGLRLFNPKVTKCIFEDINTTFEPGVLNVIMGPSGSGKSSCLNAMARRLYDSSLVRYSISGRMLLNGSTATNEVVTSICSYVPQDDGGLLSSLTVRETLHFAAGLRLPPFLSHKQKIERAESVLLKLGLKDCADTLIGSDLVKGISGGEKRRVSIAVQILTDPRVLLLDEPTSGLDAFTAFSIIEVLKGLANEGRTIIFSIHQPRSDMFSQFGGVLLLAKGGDVMYNGQASDMLSTFANQGHMCPESANPADFALDLVSRRSSGSLHVQEKAVAPNHEASDIVLAPPRSMTSPAPSKEAHLTLTAGLGLYMRTQIPFSHAFPILLQRGMKNLIRQPNLLLGRISQLVGLGIVLTAFFAPLKTDYYSVQTRVGFVQSMSSMFFIGMLNSIALYPAERDIYYHEDRDGTYPLEAFFLYYSAIEIPMELIASCIFSLLTVFAVGLNRTASLYFLMAYTSFCVVSCGESFGIIFFTMFSHTGLAVSVMTVVLSISVHLGGVLSIGIDRFLSAINHISPIKWQVGALSSYSLRGIHFSCTPAQELGDGRCPIETGEQVLDLYQLDVDTTTFALALLGVTIGYRLLAYAGLKVRKVHWRSLGSKLATTGKSATSE
ncbi:hypothetical protein LTR84_007754 [Exophiala bonariae]|uniref:ABC transporter domain-containing protein n=1 Tax=Exophiala bonariae TaxID=1690606 RepID=A0AAV9NPR1_9EURO|nr:hypothetical protein LTR84_007754 [Exophiala bonariae]